MFISTPTFKFLDVLNYLAPGITYDKWVKTYGATLTKSWLPYEWFDSPDKLAFPGLPPYMAWYSKLKNAYVLSLKEYDDCHRIFRERGMQTFGDWLEYYNNLDVAPFLEALQKMKEFYTGLGVDIFKVAVSLPSVSQQYILRKTLQPRRGYKPPELYAPNKSGVHHAEGRGGRRAVSCIHAQACGGRDTHPLSPVRERTTCQAHPGVRR